MYRTGLKGMKGRMTNMSNLAIKLAEYLEKHQSITTVHYLGLPSHSTYDVAKRLLKLNPGCIWFHVGSTISNNQMKKRIEYIGDYFSDEKSNEV